MSRSLRRTSRLNKNLRLETLEKRYLLAAEGLISHWPLDLKDQHLRDEGSAGNHLFAGSTPFVDSDRGRAIVSRDSSGDIFKQDPNLNELSNAVTVSAWINRFSFEQGGYAFAVSPLGVQLSTNGNTVQFNVATVQNNQTVETRVEGAFEFQNDAWYHIAGTYDGERLVVYVNGDDVAGTDATGTLRFDGRLFVGTGWSQDTPIRRFLGALDDVKLFNRALNAEQILELSRAPSVLETSNTASVYTPAGEPVPIAPGTEISSDQDHFGGGRLSAIFAEFTQRDGDRISVARTERILVENDDVFFLREGESIRIGEVDGADPQRLGINLNEAATPAATEALTRAIVYSTSSTEPETHARKFLLSLGIHPGTKAYADGGTVVFEQANNHTLVLETSAGATEFDPAGDPVLIDPRVEVVSNQENFDDGSLVVSFVEASGRDSDQLSLRPTNLIFKVENNVRFRGSEPSVVIGTISGGENGNPLQVNLNENATAEATEALARAIAYHNTADITPDHPRFVRFGLADGKGGETGDVKKIEFAPQNVPPNIEIPDGATHFVEGSQSVTVLPSVSVIDPDSPDFAGGSLSVTFAEESAREGDRLSIANTDLILISGNDVLITNTTIPLRVGEFEVAENGRSILVHFNHHVNGDVAELIARAIRFGNDSNQPVPGNRFVRFDIHDGDGGSDFDVRRIEVDNVNDLPVIEFSEGATVYTERSEPVPVDPRVEVEDADSSHFGGGKLIASFAEQSRRAGDHLGLQASETITIDGNDIFVLREEQSIKVADFGFDEGTLVVEFTALASVADVQAVARRITFASELDQVTPGDRFVRFAVIDAEGGVGSDVRRVEVAGVNDLPVVEFSDGATQYTEDSEPVLVDSHVEVDDPDAADFGGGKLIASFAQQSRQEGDRLGLRGSETIAVEGNDIFVVKEGQSLKVADFGFNEGALVIEFSETSDVADVQAIARHISFANELDQVTEGDRFVRFTVIDSAGGEGSDVRRIEVAGVNDPPVIEFSEGATQYTEDAEAVLVDSLVEVDDPDSADFGGGKLIASFAQQSRQDGDHLGLRGSGPILIEGNDIFLNLENESVKIADFGFNDGTLVIEFTENASVAAVGEVARHITFGSELDEIVSADRFVRFEVIDGEGARGSDIRRIEVNGANDNPIVEVDDRATLFELHEDPVIIAPHLEIVDVDSENFAGGTLIVTIIEQSSVEGDALRIRHGEGIEVDGNRVFVGSGEERTLLGEIRDASGDEIELAIELTEHATPALTERLARRITFESTAASIGDEEVRFVRFAVNDGDGGSGADVKKIELLLRPDDDFDGVDDDVERAGPNEGDGNHDGVPDSEQDRVASVRGSEDRFVTITSPETTRLINVEPMANPSPDDRPEGTEFPVGFFDFEVEGVESSEVTMVTINLEPGASANTYYVYGPTPDNTTPHWYPFLFDGETGAKIFFDRIELHYIDGERGDSDLAANGIIADPGAPGLVAHPWQNPSEAGDVNNDGVVSALDALLIINDLSRFTPRNLPVLPQGAEQLASLLLDVSGDDAASALDALRVINLLARNNASAAQSESVSAASSLNKDDQRQWDEAIDEVIGELF